LVHGQSIENTISTGSAAFHANRDGMLGLIARMRALEERTRAASAAAKERFHKRGQLLPRERVALVLDPGSPFLELSTLAGLHVRCIGTRTRVCPAVASSPASAFVSGIRCMVSANDAGIDAAAACSPTASTRRCGCRSSALENKLPYVQLVARGRIGANLLRLPRRGLSSAAQHLPANLARHDARLGLPVVLVTKGPRTPALSRPADYIGARPTRLLACACGDHRAMAAHAHPSRPAPLRSGTLRRASGRGTIGR